MTAVPKGFAEIDSCSGLFLREIAEPRENCLRLLLEEAFALPEEVTVRVGETEIIGCHPVRSTESSRLFEIIWDGYVAYSVIAESFTSLDESEEFSGRLARVYSKSHFLDYVSRATLACKEYPGPLQHTELVCERHVIEVVSTESPWIRQVRPGAALR
jgi:hypothetical protein